MRERFATEAGRLEAFSDGVLAVIITIMVLELKPPHGTAVAALLAIAPTFAAYVLSFVFVGIYWNNHHHMLRASRGIDGRVMWANLHLLFWLSLVPFTTSWLGEHPSDAVPTALYGAVLLMNAVAYTVLQQALLAVNGRNAPFARAVANDVKGKISLAIYAVAIAAAFASPAVSDVLFVVVAVSGSYPTGVSNPSSRAAASPSSARAGRRRKPRRRTKAVRMEGENAAHLATAPAARADLDVRPAGDETLVHDPASGQVHVLNAMAARILAACDGRTPLARIVDDVVAATGAERDRVAADVARICDEFRNKQLVS